MINVLIIGSGGREHAFTWKASQSDLVFAQSMLVQIAAEKIASINDLNITKANYEYRIIERS